MLTGPKTAEKLRARFDALFDKLTARLRHRTRRLDREVQTLEQKGRLSAEEARALRLEIYDFQMERGIANSQRGIRDLKSVRASASFRRSNFQQRHRNAIQPHPGRPLFEDKHLSREVLRRMGARLPGVTETMSGAQALEMLKHNAPWEECVLKPLNSSSSKGVYLVKGAERIHRVKTNLPVEGGYDALEAEMRELLENNRIPEDRWFLEEQIVREDGKNFPPRDLKFFCFYGRVGLVLEVDWLPARQMCYWKPDGTPDPGARGYRKFTGRGFTPEQREMAAALSARMPVPWVRLDFLEGPGGELVFGEMGVNCGNFEKLTRATDRRMGELFLDAEARLLFDLWKGKQFPEFSEVAKELPGFADFLAAPVPTGSTSVRPPAASSPEE